MVRNYRVELVLFVVAFVWFIVPSQAQEDIECTEDVIVQADDWLSKLSDKFYGDVLAFPAIAEATNTKSLEDDTYATIDDVDLIEPGWKLCIVGVPAAEQILGFTLDDAPIGDNTPTNLTGAIKIGAVHALSGPLRLQGQHIQNGINLAVSEINQSALLGEGRLELIWEDTAGNADRAQAAFEKLINQDEVVAVLGPTLSHSAFLANPIAQAAGVPVIGSSNIVEAVTDTGDFIFRTSMPESDIIAFTAQEAVKNLDIQRIIIVYDQNNTFTENNLSVFEQAFAAEGVEILATVPYTTGSPNFADQLSLVQDSVTDAIVLLALVEDAANIISQARQAGIRDDIRFIGAGGFSSPAFLEAGGQALNGTLTGVAWNKNNNSGNNRRFVTRYTTEYGQPPDQLAAQAYTAVWVLAGALRQSNAADPARLRDELANTRFVESPLGLFSFDENRNPDHEPVLQVVENGKFLVFQ